MKIQTLFLFVIIALGSSSLWAQSTSKVNELRLNIVSTAFLLPEITYERLLTESTGVGLSVAFATSKSNYENTQYAINSYYRLYFGEKKASGFFIEAGVELSRDLVGGEYYYFDVETFLDDDQIGVMQHFEKRHGFSAGAALGTKVSFKEGWHLDMSFGLARIFNHRNYYDYITNYSSMNPFFKDFYSFCSRRDLTFILNLSVGKRF